MHKSNGDPKPLSQIKRIFLSEVNEFLRLVAKQSPGSGLQVDFSKANKTRNTSGLFVEEGLIGMLEASDNNRIDHVSPVLDAIVDVFCENDYKALVTKVLTLYSDINTTLKRKLTLPCWADEELSKLAKMIS